MQTFDRKTPTKSTSTVAKAIKNSSRSVMSVTMSKTAETQEQQQPEERPQRCADCGRIVTVVKKDNRQLVARCKCAERQIKVRKATPQEWS